MQWLIGYLIGINLLALFLMAHDKSQARNRGRRVPERTLFLTAAVGGAIGAIAAMRIWRHKTKHVSFVVGMPAVLIVQAIIGIWLVGR
ncbi:DUF1294 domain-containing protein [Cohnella luojiensis]|uniref:DUF1294 domain-containing protein n=1 Tax=Cohnella luojiensis TaxID=652876 RepID=A0A4Y8M0C9_9BACL|nr:DUF1294 domain-containing protein [Cohnella luojiensis]TFE25819.1 DUF1294 domain-containing protein [Cohnella luojiensis]